MGPRGALGHGWVANVRKLRDGGGTVGQFIWQPSPTVGMIGGEPDRLLGYGCFSSTDVSALGNDNKVAVFGDFSAFFVRAVRSLRLERSDNLWFDRNQVALRGLMRFDSGLADTAAVNVLHCAVT